MVASGKGIAGEALCGCFGRVPTSPWFSFWLDVCVLGALCTSRVPGWRWSGPVAAVRTGAVAEALRGLRNVRRAAQGPAAACLIAAWLLTAPVLGIAGFRGARSRDLAGLGQRVGDFIIPALIAVSGSTGIKDAPVADVLLD